MAAGKINLQKASGGVTAITGVDGAGNTSIIVPESGTLATTADINTTGVALKIIATGTATFTATTNSINLTGIGVGVEIGDVIQISGAIDAKNNSEFTIEVITDANNIIVNQAHANKGTTKNVAVRSGDTGVTVKLLAKWYNASAGLGQAWQDATTSRALGTTYTNTTGKTIFIAITSGLNSTGDSSLFFSIGGVVVISTSSAVATAGVYRSLYSSLTLPIPPGGEYMCQGLAGTPLFRWMELR